MSKELIRFVYHYPAWTENACVMIAPKHYGKIMEKLVKLGFAHSDRNGYLVLRHDLHVLVEKLDTIDAELRAGWLTSFGISILQTVLYHIMQRFSGFAHFALLDLLIAITAGLIFVGVNMVMWWFEQLNIYDKITRTIDSRTERSHGL